MYFGLMQCQVLVHLRDSNNRWICTHFKPANTHFKPANKKTLRDDYKSMTDEANEK
jgi:hypothetical protein